MIQSIHRAQDFLLREPRIKTTRQNHIWLSVLIPFFCVSYFIGKDFHQHCRARMRARRGFSIYHNANIWGGSIHAISTVVSWLAGSIWHSIVCIDSFFGMARSKSCSVKFSRHTLSQKKLFKNTLYARSRWRFCCRDTKQVHISSRSQK